MIRLYFQQALYHLRENPIITWVSVLGTALAICMIMVLVITFQVRLVGYKICNFITYWFTVTYNVYQRAVLNLVSFWYHYITFVIISLNFISYIFLLYF